MKQLTTIDKITANIDACISIYGADTRVKSIGEFVKRVEKFGNNIFDQDKRNTFKGDMLEILAEVFFSIFSADPAAGIIDYVSVPLNQDYGVDGIGKNVNGDQCVIQVKYRVNPLEVLLYEDIAKTYSAGKLIHRLSLENNDTIFLFTTGSKTTTACEAVFGKKLRVLDRAIIGGYVDNNESFWSKADEIIIDTLDPISQQ